MNTSSLPRSTSSAVAPPADWTARVSEKIRQQPLKSVAQAVLGGYALRYLPVRRILSVAMRLLVPGVFVAGLYEVSKHLPVPPSER
jgi:hypothetical protein